MKTFFALLLSALSLSAAVTPPVTMLGRTQIVLPGQNLSNAFVNAQNNSTMILTPGNYTNTLLYTESLYDWPVKILNKTNFTLKANGATLYGFGAGGHIVISNCENCVFEDLTVIGNKPATSAGDTFVNATTPLFAAVDPRNSRHIKFIRPRIENAFNHGISCGDDISCARNYNIDCFGGYFNNIGATSGIPVGTSFDGAAWQPTSSDSDLIDSVVTNCLRGYEIYSNVGDISGCRIQGTRFDYIHKEAVVNVLPAAYLMRDCKILDCAFTANPTSFLSQGGVILNNGAERNLIAGNSLSGFNIGISLESSALLYNRDSSVIRNALTNCNEGIRIFGGGTLHGTNLARHLVKENTVVSCNIGLTFSGLYHRCEGNSVFGCTTGLRSYHDGSAGQTNLLIDICWNTFTHNSTHISLTSATVKSNRVIGNVFRHPQGTANVISDSGTGTYTNLNFH